MAQIETSLYNTLAQAYALVDDNLSVITTNTRAALDAVIDVTTTYGGSPSVGDADAALEIELALLGPFNAGYISSTNLVASISTILKAIKVLNNFVINQTAGTATATSKLDTWINTTMAGAWTGGSIPTGWKNLCEDAGFDVTNW